MLYYLVWLFLIVGSVHMTWKVTKFWRDPALGHGLIVAVPPFGEEVQRGELRSVGLTVVSLWGITIIMPLGLWNGELSTPLAILGLIAVGVVLCCLACEVSVVLFNRPKFVVPPHMRSDLGVIQARLLHRRSGRWGTARRRLYVRSPNGSVNRSVVTRRRRIVLRSARPGHEPERVNQILSSHSREPRR